VISLDFSSTWVWATMTPVPCAIAANRWTEVLRRSIWVNAGMDGVLQRLGNLDNPLQVGQQLPAGALVARVANPAKLKAEIKSAPGIKRLLLMASHTGAVWLPVGKHLLPSLPHFFTVSR